MSKKLKVLNLILLLLILCINTSFAVENQKVVTETQAQAAFEYAIKYVNHQVAYKLGGRLTVEQYLVALAEGEEPGAKIGVDASAIVINAYRDVLPSLLFKPNSTSNNFVSDISSNVLYHWNSEPVNEGELIKGDLIFFKNTSGNIMGVGLFSHIHGNVIHFITASQNAGKVILSNVDMKGDYWKDHFAGFARLKYYLK